ncbi:MAG: helix-turn-helix domain-containing protein [Actinomycetota bacterium]|nr:helix-turn-helix domain-containing protein [Actinomycetota bacterium]
MGTGKRKRRHRVEPTDDWEQLELLCGWDEQVEYERIKPLVLFGEPVAGRALETGTSERTLQRRISGFEREGMESLFGSSPAKRRVLPGTLRRLILDLKAEHPALNANEIANICYVFSGRKPDVRTVGNVLDEEPLPLRAFRRFDPYHEIPDARERRKAVIRLHYEGWTDKSIARYLKVDRSTVHRVVRRWIEEGLEGLEDKKRGRPKGVRKVDLRAMDAVRRMQENPDLGAFRMRSALEQAGIHLSVRTVGRILRTNRDLYDLEKPKRSPHQKREMPFEASYRHEFWTSDVRYIDHSLPETGNVYVVSILENYSRTILASAVTLAQDTNAYLSVLYAAVERYGSPKTIVTDGGGIFRAGRSMAVYEALGIRKEEIERRQPWQSFIETTFNIQRRMADHYFAKAESWEELVAEHDRWLTSYNTQRHWAHEDRADGRRSPSEVLGWVTGVRYHPDDLERAFFSTRFTRKLDALGYARLKHWRVYAEEGLARCEVALWLGADGLSVEYGGQALSSYDVSLSSGSTRLKDVTNPRLFVTRHRTPQLKLFALEDALGEGGWLKALRLEEYAARTRRRPQALQDVLFPYLDAL